MIGRTTYAKTSGVMKVSFMAIYFFACRWDQVFAVAVPATGAFFKRRERIMQDKKPDRSILSRSGIGNGEFFCPGTPLLAVDIQDRDHPVAGRGSLDIKIKVAGYFP
jgi:hypothetical protein